MKDGSAFDPAETVLFEKEEFGDREFVPPQIGDPANAEAKVVRYEPQRIELRTRNLQPGFLVLSEIYYPGWEARIDGRRAPVERVNYLLRGLAVPAGDHHIEFVFRSHSFRAGAVLSLLGVLLLFVGANSRVRGKVESWMDGPVNRMLTLAWANSKRLAPIILTAVESKLSALSRSKFVKIVAVAGVLIYGGVLVKFAVSPFPVNPIAGALSLLLIYLIGLELGLPRGFSIGGAIMLAASPTLVYLALRPMSDTLAMFWGLVAILGALRSRKRDGWAFLAWAAFGMAFLTRPTNVLLLIPLLFSLRLKHKTILFFLLGGLSPAAMFFTYNTVALGHPLEIGHGWIGLWDALGFGGFKERFDHYWYWIKVTMSPLPLLCWPAVAADRKVEWRNRLMLLSWFGAFFLFHCCYSVYDKWWHTGFLLPGYPAMILGAVLIARDLPELFRISESNRARLKWVVLIVMVAVTLSLERRYLRKFDVFNVGAGVEEAQKR